MSAPPAYTPQPQLLEEEVRLVVERRRHVHGMAKGEQQVVPVGAEKPQHVAVGLRVGRTEASEARRGLLPGLGVHRLVVLLTAKQLVDVLFVVFHVPKVTERHVAVAEDAEHGHMQREQVGGARGRERDRRRERPGNRLIMSGSQASSR